MATRDVPESYGSGCHLRFADAKPASCAYGRADAPVTIALVGDSKAAQWLPALRMLADRNGWRVVAYTKSSCAFNSSMDTLHGKPYTACYEWNRAVMKELLGPAKPDFVLTSQQRGAEGADPELVSALLDWWRPLQAAGIRVIAMANNQTPSSKVYECVERHPRKLTRCSFKRGHAKSNASLRAASKQLPGAAYIDITDAVCPTRRCAPVIGNVLVYRQGSHLTRTYVRTLAPRLETALLQAGVPSADKQRKTARSGSGSTADDGRSGKR